MAFTTDYLWSTMLAIDEGRFLMTTLDLRLEVSDEIVEYLKAEAKNRQVSLDTVFGDILTDYFTELTDDQILESIKVGMKQARAT